MSYKQADTFDHPNNKLQSVTRRKSRWDREKPRKPETKAPVPRKGLPIKQRQSDRQKGGGIEGEGTWCDCVHFSAFSCLLLVPASGAFQALASKQEVNILMSVQALCLSQHPCYPYCRCHVLTTQLLPASEILRLYNAHASYLSIIWPEAVSWGSSSLVEV